MFELTKHEKDLLVKGAMMIQVEVVYRGGPDYAEIVCPWCGAYVNYGSLTGFGEGLSDENLEKMLRHHDDCNLSEYNALIKRLTE